MALLIDPIIIILLVVITQSGHIPIALKVILCIVLACVGTIMGICMFRGIAIINGKQEMEHVVRSSYNGRVGAEMYAAMSTICRSS